jgi:hypothetical protein
MNIVDQMLPGTLSLDCYKCTRTEEVPGATSKACQRIAFAMGWRADDHGLVCGKCPGGGTQNLPLELAIEMERQFSAQETETPWERAAVAAIQEAN